MTEREWEGGGGYHSCFDITSEYYSDGCLLYLELNEELTYSVSQTFKLWQSRVCSVLKIL
jgi:hypothetical protein